MFPGNQNQCPGLCPAFEGSSLLLSIRRDPAPPVVLQVGTPNFGKTHWVRIT